MGPELREIAQFAKEALKLETMTTPGKVNSLGMLFAFALLVALGLPDILQTLVRIFDDDYTTGLPAFEVLFGMYIALVLICVAMLLLLERRPRDVD